jgi:hypothetical protein
MQTLNQLSTLDFRNNLLLNALNKDDKSAAVYDFSGGYNVIDFIATRNAPARRIDGDKGIFYKPIIGKSTPVAQVASTSLVGSNLQVNFTDATFDNFRLKEVLGDGTAAMNQGRVIQKGPGFVIMEPTPGTGAWNTSTHFVAGTFAIPMFVASGNRGSTGVESLYEYPKYVSNQTGITRDSLLLYARDASKTWVEFQGDYWYMSQELFTTRRFARNLEKKAIWSQMGTTTNSALEGEINYSKGLKDSILDPERGGVYLPLTSSLSQGQFEGWISQIADRQNQPKYTLTMGVGRGFLNWIQSFTTPFIQFAGVRNTFGGETVQGLDVYEYTINGVRADLIHIPFFNDRDLFPALSSVPNTQRFTRMQYTAIVLDTGMYESIDGQMLPAIEKVFFGPEEVRYAYIPGMIGSSVSGNNFYTSGDLKLAVTDKDAVSLEIYSDCAYDFMSYRMGWAELVI